MRQIEKQIINHIQNWKEGNLSKRDSIKIQDDTLYVYLWKTIIARIVRVKNGYTLTVSNGNYKTSTTKSRLNSILYAFTNTGVYQNNFNWYFSDNTEFKNGSTFIVTKGM